MPRTSVTQAITQRFGTPAPDGPAILKRFLQALKGDSRIDVPSRLFEMAESLLSVRGEASGVALARQLLQEYSKASDEERQSFLLRVARELGPRQDALDAAVAAYCETRSHDTALALHRAAESRRQELLRRMNHAPGGTQRLVRMREDVLRGLEAEPDLQVLDGDFAHLLTSWFNRGFLQLQRIDWTTPAEILERIIRYEAVHQIGGWEDLRRRIDPPDRRCFGFFHPALRNDPLVFVEVALTPGIPGSIAPLLAERESSFPPEQADTAVFYSISNCHDGLRGVSFGNFLIKQVVEELLHEFPGLKTFATLSPIPGFVRWLRKQVSNPGAGLLAPEVAAQLEPLTKPGASATPAVLEALKPSLNDALLAYLSGKDAKGRPLDPVARFHLGNGARLDRIHWIGDMSEKGIAQSLGFMVSYLYDLKHVESNHEAFVSKGEIALSSQLRKSLVAMNRKRELSPAA